MSLGSSCRRDLPNLVSRISTILLVAVKHNAAMASVPSFLSKRKERLERVLQSKLYLSIVGSCVGDGPAPGHVHCDLGTASGQTEIGMIEKVKELRAEFQRLGLAHLKILLQDEIKVHQIRPAEIADSGIPKHVCGLLSRCEGWRNEGSLVEPAIQRLVPRIRAAEVRSLRCQVEGEVIRVGNLIGPVTEAPGVAQVSRHARRHGFATLSSCDPSELPTTEECIRDASRTSKPALAVTHRKLIQI